MFKEPPRKQILLLCAIAREDGVHASALLRRHACALEKICVRTVDRVTV